MLASVTGFYGTALRPSSGQSLVWEGDPAGPGDGDGDGDGDETDGDDDEGDDGGGDEAPQPDDPEPPTDDDGAENQEP
jgi:hypothetical protein